LCSPLAAWFPGGATRFRPYRCCHPPLSEPCVRYSRTRLPTRSFAGLPEQIDRDPGLRQRESLFPRGGLTTSAEVVSPHKENEPTPGCCR
jgi:hypothetical protein